MHSTEQLLAKHRQAGKYVKVDDLRIFYRCAGPSQGIPLVMTHGIPRSSFLYRKMIPRLAERHSIRALDLYGFGLSDKPPEDWRYTFPEFERFLGKFLDTLKIKRAHFICHDVGGPFTLGYAVRNPHRVASLIILNSTIFIRGFNIPGPVLASIVAPIALQRLVLDDETFCSLSLRYLHWRTFQNPEALSGIEGEVWKQLLCRAEGRLSLVKTVKSYRVVLPYLLEIQQALPRFYKPTQIIWGKQDPFCTVATALKFNELIPQAELQIIPEASHFLQEDAPEKTSRIILDFIDAVPVT